MSLDIDSITSSSHHKDRLRAAKQYLAENPTEKQVTAARIFKLHPKALSNSIARKPPSRYGGQNKILTESQERAVHTFIRSYLQHNQKPTRPIVLSAITYLRAQENKPRPSESWFTKWWKGQPLHKITTKPLAKARIEAQDIQVVKDWFIAYRELLDKYQFQAKDIYNFDETGFRVGCARGTEVLVPTEVREVCIDLISGYTILANTLQLYSLSPENRKSITLIESINASGDNLLPPVLIIEGKWHMDSWYREKLKAGERVLLSETGFTSDDLGLIYLEHFIQHTGATPGGPFILLLMDNHGSHRTPQFILLAYQHNIILFSFPAHMSHCMQPLDVGCFQTEKHWHTKAIEYTLDNLDFDYSIASFLRDLPEIRAKTFQKSIIRDAF
jgi:hypothetical protein